MKYTTRKGMKYWQRDLSWEKRQSHPYNTGRKSVHLNRVTKNSLHSLSDHQAVCVSRVRQREQFSSFSMFWWGWRCLLSTGMWCSCQLFFSSSSSLIFCQQGINESTQCSYPFNTVSFEEKKKKNEQLQSSCSSCQCDCYIIRRSWTQENINIVMKKKIIIIVNEKEVIDNWYRKKYKKESKQKQNYTWLLSLPSSSSTREDIEENRRTETRRIRYKSSLSALDLLFYPECHFPISLSLFTRLARQTKE